MKKVLKVYVLIVVGILSIFFVSCKDHNDIYQGPPEEKPKEFNDFDYTTEQDITLQISYLNMGGIQASVDFEVYDQMPIEETEYTLVKKEGVEPIYADRTENDGTFNKKLPFPTYAKTLYIYTHAFYAQTLLTAKVENGIAVATDEIKDDARAVTVGSRAANNYCIPVKDEGWLTWLGAYDSDRGYIKYTYTGDLAYTLKEAANLYAIQSNVIYSGDGKNCPQEYRASTDMYIGEAAEIAITLLGGNTCWNSSMGYYYYKEGETPTSLDNANVILIFPNTQDGQWSNDKTTAQKYQGVNRGTSVLLKYYPNIANNSKEGETTVFPAGYRIGFVLATNGWTGRLPNFQFQEKKYRAATSKGLSIKNNGEPYAEPRTAVYRYVNESINAVMFSFEDHDNDQNFSDVVFTLKSNPIDAIEDIPEISNNTTTVKTVKGTYAFEDLWPKAGDYDMNDVIVLSRYEKKYDASVDNKGIYEESFIFKTLENKANNQNGLGFTLVNGGSNTFITLTIDGQEAEYQKEGDVFLLTDNVKKYMGKDYKLTFKYKEAVKNKGEASNKPFIWKNSENGNWEVHIAQEAPTPLADHSYFNTEDDASTGDKYYVRTGNYPFAFFLSGATETDISQLLEPVNESKPIDELYPNYGKWVSTGGMTNQDWYK